MASEPTLTAADLINSETSSVSRWTWPVSRWYDLTARVSGHILSTHRPKVAHGSEPDWQELNSVPPADHLLPQPEPKAAEEARFPSDAESSWVFPTLSGRCLRLCLIC